MNLNDLLKKYHEGKIAKKKNKLTVLFAETLRMMITNPKLHNAINSSVRHQLCILEEDALFSFYDKKINNKSALIEVVNARSFEAAEVYRRNRTCVLNFACSVEPGGGVLVGSIAQEESLCRASTLYPCLCSKEAYEKFYLPHIKEKFFLGKDDCIYTPNVIVFQSDTLYPKLRPEEEWFEVGIITCSAPALNHTELKDYSLYDLHYRRMIRILDVAANHKNDVIILGAFGCGAFLNDPNIVAQAMVDAVKHYQYVFKSIIFAIPKSVTNRNYKIFYECFQRYLR